MYLDEAKAAFSYSGLATPNEVRGCTDSEIAGIEQRIGHGLPAAYREFLVWMGHGAGDLFEGSNAFYQHLPSLLASAQELLQENNILTPMPNDAFVFFMHQGYQCMFFRLAEGENPPVYYYGEGEGQDTFRVLYPNYSSFLDTEIKGHAEVLAHMKQKHLKEIRVENPDRSVTYSVAHGTEADLETEIEDVEPTSQGLRNEQ